MFMQGGYLQHHKKHPPVGASASSAAGWPGLLLDTAASPGVHGNASDLVTSFASQAHPTTAAAASASAAASGLFGGLSDVISTNLDLLTLSNVAPGSQRMWVHLASTYVITLVALKVRRSWGGRCCLLVHTGGVTAAGTNSSCLLRAQGVLTRG